MGGHECRFAFFHIAFLDERGPGREIRIEIKTRETKGGTRARRDNRYGKTLGKTRGRARHASDHRHHTQKTSLSTGKGKKVRETTTQREGWEDAATTHRDFKELRPRKDGPQQQTYISRREKKKEGKRQPKGRDGRTPPPHTGILRN